MFSASPLQRANWLKRSYACVGASSRSSEPAGAFGAMTRYGATPAFAHSLRRKLIRIILIIRPPLLTRLLPIKFFYKRKVEGSDGSVCTVQTPRMTWVTTVTRVSADRLPLRIGIGCRYESGFCAPAHNLKQLFEKDRPRSFIACSRTQQLSVGP